MYYNLTLWVEDFFLNLVKWINNANKFGAKILQKISFNLRYGLKSQRLNDLKHVVFLTLQRNILPCEVPETIANENIQIIYIIKVVW